MIEPEVQALLREIVADLKGPVARKVAVADDRGLMLAVIILALSDKLAHSIGVPAEDIGAAFTTIAIMRRLGELPQPDHAVAIIASVIEKQRETEAPSAPDASEVRR